MDVYALGTIIYYMVMMRDPEGVIDRLNENKNELADEIKDSGISEVARKSMKINSAERYRTCGELLEKIDDPKRVSVNLSNKRSTE